MSNAAQNFFPGGATAFRAHGDEFYLGGRGDGSDVGAALDGVRRSIGDLRVRAPESDAVMRATASVGWATDQDALPALNALTVRAFRGAVESAVAEAKVERDRVIRFAAAEHQKRVSRAGRADCPNCRTKFDVRVPVDNTNGEPLWCPNCGARVPRPVGLEPSG